MVSYICSLFSRSLPRETPNSGNSNPAKSSWEEANRRRLVSSLFNELAQNLTTRVLLFTPEKREEEKEPVIIKIVFRQTASWLKVEELLNLEVAPDLRDDRQPLTQFRDRWFFLIYNLRKFKTFYDQVNNKIKSHGSSPFLDDALNQLRNGILHLIDQGSINLGNDSRNENVTQFPSAQKTIRFLQTYWEDLTVFGRWLDASGASMDKEQLLVKVIKDEGVIPTSFCTKAVIPVKVVKKEEFIARLRSTIIRTTGLEINKRIPWPAYGPPSPIPARQAAGMPGAPIFGRQIREEEAEELVAIMAMTGKKDFIDGIVNEAIDKVNESLSDNRSAQ